MTRSASAFRNFERRIRTSQVSLKGLRALPFIQFRSNGAGTLPTQPRRTV